MPAAKPQLPVSGDLARFGRACSADPVIDRTGGRFGAGIIRGVSLSVVGEAIGHDYWLDALTIDQVAKFSQATGEAGLKCRFSHPDMSSDGIGRHLGRIHDVRAIGDKAVGDLHFTKSSHETPDGDLAEYVMSLTSEDPKAAGLSIVFVRDVAAEKEFSEKNTTEQKYRDARGKERVERRFVSPDRANKKDLPHCRILHLKAADIVDEPAANPDGMFDAQPLARNADALLSYAAGLTKEKPDVTALGIDSDRASQFLGRWLESHGLSIVRSDKQVGTAEASHTKPATPSRSLAPQPQTDASLERFDKACDALRKAYAGRNDELANLRTPGPNQMKSDLDITDVEPVDEIGRPTDVEPYLYDNIERQWLRHRFPSVETNLQELGAALLAYRMNPASPKPVKRFGQLGVELYEIGALDAEVSFGEMLDFTLKCEGVTVPVSAQNDAILDQIAIIGAIEV